MFYSERASHDGTGSRKEANINMRKPDSKEVLKEFVRRLTQMNSGLEREIRDSLLTFNPEVFLVFSATSADRKDPELTEFNSLQSHSAASRSWHDNRKRRMLTAKTDPKMFPAPACPMRKGRAMQRDHHATLYVSAFYVKRAFLLLVLLLLLFMHMLYCFLLLALFLALPAALVSHCAPPFCTWNTVCLILYHFIFPGSYTGEVGKG
jgi:hypothetical protein